MQGITLFITAEASRMLTFGLIMFLGSGLFGSYYYYKAPVKIEDYYFTIINYQQVYLKESANKIVLVSEAKEYGLPILLLNARGKADLSEVLNKLKLSNTAEVWLDAKNTDSPFIRGISTTNFSLSPEIGADEDNKDDKSIAAICVWFAGGGIAVIFIGLLQFLSDKASKRKS